MSECLQCGKDFGVSGMGGGVTCACCANVFCDHCLNDDGKNGARPWHCWHCTNRYCQTCGPQVCNFDEEQRTVTCPEHTSGDIADTT